MMATIAAAEAQGVLPLILALALLIAAAKVSGDLATRLGQPAVLGELAAGLILGPSIVNLMGWPVFAGSQAGQAIHEFGQIGVLLLMFVAGLETELDDLRVSGKPALLAGVLGVIGPITLGLGAGVAFGQRLPEALFIGVVLSATSVSISAQTLLEIGRLRTREGVTLLGAAVIDDVLVIVVLSVLLALASGVAEWLGVLLQLGRMVLVLIVVAAVGLFLVRRMAEPAARLGASQSLLALVLSAALLLAWATEYLGGMAAITGAFLAGVGLSRSHLRAEIEAGLKVLAYAFFVPLFLVDIGLQANLRTLSPEAWVFAAALVLVAAASKVMGSGLGAWLGGFNRAESLRVGLGMVSRGEVGLIVAGVGVAEGILAPELYDGAVLMVLATTLLTPPLLRLAFHRQEGDHGTAS